MSSASSLCCKSSIAVCDCSPIAFVRLTNQDDTRLQSTANENASMTPTVSVPFCVCANTADVNGGTVSPSTEPSNLPAQEIESEMKANEIEIESCRRMSRAGSTHVARYKL